MPADLRFREFSQHKIWHHSKRMLALANGQDIAPITVEIDPVAYCNHRCVWCVDPAHRRITADQRFLLSLLDDLSKFSVGGFQVRGLVFKGGGEPTLHPDFFMLLEKAGNLGFEIGVVTNGSRLTEPDISESLARRADYVRVSIDGPTPETHCRIHGTQDFEKIITGVKSLVDIRANRFPVIGLSFALDHAMISEIPRAILLGEELGVDYILMRPPFFEEVGRRSTMTLEQAAELRQALAEAAREYKGALNIFIGDWVGDAEHQNGARTADSSMGRRDKQIMEKTPIEHRIKSCFASPLLAIIAADAHVYGCCNLRFHDKWSFGQLNYEKGVTLGKIWCSNRRRKILAKMRRIQCISYCTHPMARYNEIIEVLRDKDRPHAGFV